MAGPIRVAGYVTKRGVSRRATTRFKSFANGPGMRTNTLSRGGRSLSITTRPTGAYARGIRPGGGVLGQTYKVTPSSQRRFFALARRVGL